jgi:hypothetical protein
MLAIKFRFSDKQIEFLRKANDWLQISEQQWDDALLWKF